MLATLSDTPFSNPAWIYERKFDGERALAFKDGATIRLLSRNDLALDATYPELVDALRKQRARRFIIDGEVVAFRGRVTSFEQLQARLGVRQPSPELRRRVPVFYYVFDVLYLEGADVTQLPLRERKALLSQALRFRDPLRYSEHREKDGVRFLHEACVAGWEGVIAKRADSSYVHVRSRDWLKFKCSNEQEFVIGGYTDPQGSRTGFGALLVGYYDRRGLRYAGKVGTGYNERTLTDMSRRLRGLARQTSPFAEDVREHSAHWVKPDLVAQVGFTEWTRDGKLRHPRFLGLRRDKPAHRVVRERPG
jgi:DNA ligase D-like protein (predicted ligase)